jgi:teichuronic acid exporter
VNNSSNYIYKGSERFFSQLFGLFISIILARLIEPSSFGIFALLLTITSLIEVLLNNVFNFSLLQRKNPLSSDFSNLIFINFFLGALLYFLVFIFSKPLSDLFQIPIFSYALKIIGIKILFNSILIVQITYLTKKFNFKLQLIVSFISILISGLLGVILATLNFGLWALILQSLSFSVTQVIIYLLFFRFDFIRPNIFKIFSFFSESWKFTLTVFLDTFFTQARSLIIGLLFSPSSLAFYQKGFHFPELIMSNLISTIGTITFPQMSISQDNKKIVLSIIRKTIKHFSFLVFPMMIGLAVIGDNLINLLFGINWADSYIFLLIGVFSMITWPMQVVSQNAINAIGKSNIYLRIEIIRRIFNVCIFLLSLSYGIIGIAIGLLISELISFLIVSIYTRRLFKYLFLDQFNDFIWQFVISVFMGILILQLELFIIDTFFLMLIQITLGILVYLLISFILKVHSLNYFYQISRKYLISFFNRRIR